MKFFRLTSWNFIKIQKKSLIYHKNFPRLEEETLQKCKTCKKGFPLFRGKPFLWMLQQKRE